MKAKVNMLKENSKNKNIQEMYNGINEFKKGYQPHPYVAKKYDGKIMPNTIRILNRWKRCYRNFLNVNQSNSREGSETCTVEADIPEPSLLEIEINHREFKKE
jgi:hypothetical protein